MFVLLNSTFRFEPCSPVVKTVLQILIRQAVGCLSRVVTPALPLYLDSILRKNAEKIFMLREWYDLWIVVFDRPKTLSAFDCASAVIG
jgi:hypothetical protein